MARRRARTPPPPSVATRLRNAAAELIAVKTPPPPPTAAASGEMTLTPVSIKSSSSHGDRTVRVDYLTKPTVLPGLVVGGSGQQNGQDDAADSDEEVVTEIREYNAHTHQEHRYQVPDGSWLGVRPVTTAARLNPTAWLKLILASVFLPAGYPNSVADEYLKFQVWDTIQGMCSYLRGILATRAILEGLGVGNEMATPLAATVQWVLRDGASMLGGLVFAWWGGTRFDPDVKSWRLFADLINDVGLTIDMFAPLAGPWFLHVACVGSICRALCGVAAGSVRSSITAHFARADNLADVAAKEGSQETAVTLLGLIAGLLFAQTVNQSAAAIWVAFVLLTVLHVYANYVAVHALQLRTLNRSRLDTLLRFHEVGRLRDMVPNVVNQHDYVVRSLWTSIVGYPIRMGVTLNGVISTRSWSSTATAFQCSVYAIGVSGSRSRPRVLVALTTEATVWDELQAYCHARKLLSHLINKRLSPAKLTMDIMSSTRQAAETQTTTVRPILTRHEWNCSRLFLNDEGWRYHVNVQTSK